MFKAIGKLVILATALLLMPTAWAQFTTVTGTVVDPNSVPYARGTITAQLVIAGVTPTLNGGSFSMTGSAGLDSAGRFTMRLADNALISPNTLQWRFTVCSGIGTVNPAVGTGSQCFTPAPITITGTTQSISAQLQAAALALTVPFAAGSVSFANITGGTNTTATMLVGTGASLDTSGSGTILSFNNNGTQVTTSELGGFGSLNNPSSTNDTGAGQNYTGSVTAVDGSRTCTNTALNSFCEGVHGFISWQNASSSVNATAIGGLFYATVPSSNSQAIGTLVGMEASANYYGAGGAANNWGTWASAYVASGSSGLIGSNAGSQVRAFILPGAATNVTKNYGVLAVTGISGGATGTIDSDYVFAAESFSSYGALISHRYAYWVGSQNSAGGANNPDPWGFYEEASTERNRLGPITQDQGIATAGLTHPIQTGVDRQVSQTTSIGSTLLYTVGAADTSYIVQGSVVCHTAVATGTISLSITYTDISNTAQTIQTSAAPCDTLGAASFAMINPTLIQAKASTTINYLTTDVNSANYDVRAQVYQASAN